MKSDNLNQILELRENHVSDVVVKRRPIFYYISCSFSILAVWLLVYLFNFYQRKEGMGGMFDGLQYVLGAVAALGVGFICTVIGFFRSEKANLLLKIHSVLSTLFALLVLFLLGR